MSALHLAILGAQKAMRPVPKSEKADVKKDGKTLYSYNFASTEQVIIACRSALHENGLIVRRVAMRVDSEHRPPTLHSTFRVTHAESGEHEDTEVPMPIAGTGAADKAVAGAATYTWSYYLRDLLCIARADDDEDRDKQSEGQSFTEPPRESSRKVTTRKSSGGKDKAEAKGQVTTDHEAEAAMQTIVAVRRTHDEYMQLCKAKDLSPNLLSYWLERAQGRPLDETAKSTKGESMPLRYWEKAQDLLIREITILTKTREPGEDAEEDSAA